MMDKHSIYQGTKGKSAGWPIMLADMGLLLMAFFALMVAQSQDGASAARNELAEAPAKIDVPKDAESLMASIRDNHVRFEPLDLPATYEAALPAQPVTPVDPVEDLYHSLKDNLAARNLFVDRAGDSIVISLGAVGNFAPGSADLDASALRMIQSLGNLLGGLKSEIAIEGHADAAPVSGGRYKDNWELAGARATAVLRELSRSSGISGSSLMAVSFGDRRPVVVADDPKMRERNRRVEIRIRPI